MKRLAPCFLLFMTITDNLKSRFIASFSWFIYYPSMKQYMMQYTWWFICSALHCTQTCVQYNTHGSNIFCRCCHRQRILFRSFHRQRCILLSALSFPGVRSTTSLCIHHSRILAVSCCSVEPALHRIACNVPGLRRGLFCPAWENASCKMI